MLVISKSIVHCGHTTAGLMSRYIYYLALNSCHSVHNTFSVAVFKKMIKKKEHGLDYEITKEVASLQTNTFFSFLSSVAHPYLFYCTIPQSGRTQQNFRFKGKKVHWNLKPNLLSPQEHAAAAEGSQMRLWKHTAALRSCRQMLWEWEPTCSRAHFSLKICSCA